jgi:23S rRNA (guanosine2251-2'-O)-methyltransferase
MKDRKIAAAFEILYGRQTVRELLRAKRRSVKRLVAQQGTRSTAELAEIAGLAGQAGISLRECDRQELDRLAQGGHHQGILAETSPYPYVELDALIAEFASLREPALVLLLDHIEDPQNLGSLLRSADAAGVHGIVIPQDRAAEVTPAAVRASSGAAEHLKVSLVVNLVRAMNELKEAGLWIAGLEQSPESKPIGRADLGGPLALVVGSEGHGMGRLVRETCDYLVFIPMRGKVGSLNAGVAGGIGLFEIGRQREAAAAKAAGKDGREGRP